MEFDLTTTLKAYPKVSPSILKDYVTKDDLTTELGSFVEEAPEDGYTYARKGGEWITISDTVLLVDKEVYYGPSRLERLCSKKDIVDLGHYDMVSKDRPTFNVTADVRETAFFWIACTAPIRNITWMNGYLADYEPQLVTVEQATDHPYFCYRIREPLLPGVKSFKLIF